MKIPQTSSMTIQPGSSVPESFIALFTNGIAAKNTMRATGKKEKIHKNSKVMALGIEKQICLPES